VVSLNEPLPTGQDPEAHPRLQAATRSILAAQAAFRLALIANRDSPEIGVVAGRNRDIRGTEYDTTIGLRLKVPFATDARNAPRRAAAQADVLTAQICRGAPPDRGRACRRPSCARGRAGSDPAHRGTAASAAAGGGAVAPLLQRR
jgi:hypothetical protein